MPHRRHLVEFIHANTDSMAQRWLHIVRRHSGTTTYHTWAEEDLLPRAVDVFRNLTESIPRPTMKKPVAEYYTALGRQRCREGFAISEVVQAMIITRRVLWFRVQAEHFLEKGLTLEQTVDLYNRVLLFFDRAIYYAAQGFEEASRTEAARLETSRTVRSTNTRAVAHS